MKKIKTALLIATMLASPRVNANTWELFENPLYSTNQTLEAVGFSSVDTFSSIKTPEAPSVEITLAEIESSTLIIGENVQILLQNAPKNDILFSTFLTICLESALEKSEFSQLKQLNDLALKMPQLLEKMGLTHSHTKTHAKAAEILKITPLLIREINKTSNLTVTPTTSTPNLECL